MTAAVRSMTGFGRGEAEAAGCRFTAEIRSVNARFVEVTVRLPWPDAALEDRLRAMVRERVLRGRVELSVAVRRVAGGGLPQVDRELALSYYLLLKELANSLGIKQTFDLTKIIQLPGVIRPETDPDGEEWAPAVVAAAEAALDRFLGMRRAEGARLAEDLLNRLGALERLAQVIAERAPVAVAAYRDRLAERVARLPEAVRLDESRLAMEVALLAERTGITEEIVRLRSHLAEGRRLLSEGADGGVGRPLEFLLQEMHREINTIGSKGSDVAVARAVLQAKGELEKLREQVQNVE